MRYEIKLMLIFLTFMNKSMTSKKDIVIENISKLLTPAISKGIWMSKTGLKNTATYSNGINLTEPIGKIFLFSNSDGKGGCISDSYVKSPEYCFPITLVATKYERTNSTRCETITEATAPNKPKHL